MAKHKHKDKKVNPADDILKNADDLNKAISGMFVYPQIFEGVETTALLKKIISPAEIDEDEDLSKEQGEEAQPTNQKRNLGFTNQTVPHPVDIFAARSLKDISSHHASCIQSKKYSTLGLGFVSDAAEVEGSKKKTNTSVADTEDKVQSLLTGEAFIESKVDKVLDPLTLTGFMSELYKSVEDFLDGGTGYLEVVRDTGGNIIGINWLPYEDVRVMTVRDDKNKTRIVYRYTTNAYITGSASPSITRIYSMFGKANRQWVFDTFYANKDAKGKDLEDPRLDDNNNITNVSGVTLEQVSEVIPFMVPSNRSRYYGYPEWLSAATFVTLLAMALQYKSDFYTNKGVLAYILAITGPVSGDKWKEIERLIQGSVGAGNNFKNMAIQVPDPKAKVTVHKLASSDKTELQFDADQEVFAQNIVSAHRVPPVLANILIPGKLGATNEAVQALMSFQLLVIGPYQNMIQKTLARTLGGPEGLKDKLKPEDFRLRTITSQFDIKGLDTVARAKEEAVTNPDRDFSDGVRD